MEKADWELSLKNLETLKNKLEKDLEEISYTIECYKNKIVSFDL